MLWKNLLVLVGFVWLTVSYSAHPVVAEDMSDAWVQKYEESGVKKEAKRTLAEEAPESELAKEPVEKDSVKYWRWQEDSTN